LNTLGEDVSSCHNFTKVFLMDTIKMFLNNPFLRILLLIIPSNKFLMITYPDEKKCCLIY